MQGSGRNIRFSPPVGLRVGRGKMTAGFRNKIDAKKPDSRKNQAFLELLARFELATSSLPTALEYKNRCIPALLSCFPWKKSSHSALLRSTAFNPNLHFVGQVVGQDFVSVPANNRERSKPLPGAVADCSFP